MINDTPAKVIQKHFHLKGPNWTKLINALAVGDQINWDNNVAAFDQLFVSSASGKYLERQGNDRGVLRPKNTGMSDETFRKLIIELSTGRVVHESIKRILEFFYGTDSFHAYAQTELVAPFNIAEGTTLTWTLDEALDVSHTFSSDQFNDLANVQAVELAVVLTRAMQDAGSQGFALPFVDPESGTKVRIYSNTLGLGSFVRVTSGSSQVSLRFDTYKDVYVGDATGTQWVFTHPTTTTSRISNFLGATPTLVGIDVNGIVAGDYLVVTGGSKAGVYNILDVSVTESGGVWYQILDIEYTSLTGSINLTSNSHFTFYTPTKRSTYNGQRTVVVAQVGNDQLDVVIPATSEAVDRTIGTATYLQGNEPVSVTRMTRDENGLVTVIQPAHGLSAGDTIKVDDFRSAPSRAWATLLEDNGDLGYTQACFMTSAGVNYAGAILDRSKVAALESGDSIWTGGKSIDSAVAATVSDAVETVEIGEPEIYNDGSEADGATRRAWRRTDLPTLAQARVDHAMTTILDGVLVTGGHSQPTVLDSVERYSVLGNAWTTVSPMNVARKNHCQVTLQDGNVLVLGGSIDDYNATSGIEKYTIDADAWTVMAPMSTPRTNFQATVMSDGKVLVTGGRTLGINPPRPTNLVAWWKFDETAGATAADESAYGATLTDGGTATTPDEVGKIGRGRGFVGGSYMTATLDSQARTDLYNPGADRATLTEIWFTEGGSGTLFSVAKPTVSTVRIQVKLNADNSLTIRSGATNYTTPIVVPVGTGKFYKMSLVTYYHGAQVDYNVFINGIFVYAQYNLTPPDSGDDDTEFIVGADYNLANSFVGTIDQLMFSFVDDTGDSLTSTILRNFYQEGGDDWDGNVDSYHYTCNTLASAELYDPTGNTWTTLSPMALARAYHSQVLVDDRLFITGGRAFVPNSYLNVAIAAPDSAAAFAWPADDTAKIELYHYLVSPLFSGITMGALPRSSHQALVIGSKIYLTGGAKRTEYLDLETNTIGLSVKQYWNAGNRNAAVVNNGIIVSRGGGWGDGGVTPYADFVATEFIVPKAEINSGIGMNGEQVVETVIDSDTYTFQTPYRYYASNYGSQGDGEILSDTTFLQYYPPSPSLGTVYSRTSNVTSTVMSSFSPSYFPPQKVGPGDKIFVNQYIDNSPVGAHSTFSTVLSAAPADTYTTQELELTYEDVGSNIILVTGAPTASISVEFSQPTVTVAAAPDATNGSYIIDPNAVMTLETLDTEGTQVTVMATVPKNTQQQFLSVSDAEAFSVDGGYIILGLGTAEETVVKYLSVVAATEPEVDDDKLLLDYDFVFPFEIAVGTTVNNLVSKAPGEAAGDRFILTASTAGRVAAETLTDESVSAGVQLNIDITYPGDRGLGAEGAPTEGQARLSDQVTVWGGDDLTEEKELRRKS